MRSGKIRRKSLRRKSLRRKSQTRRRRSTRRKTRKSTIKKGRRTRRRRSLRRMKGGAEAKKDWGWGPEREMWDKELISLNWFLIELKRLRKDPPPALTERIEELRKKLSLPGPRVEDRTVDETDVASGSMGQASAQSKKKAQASAQSKKKARDASSTVAVKIKPAGEMLNIDNMLSDITEGVENVVRPFRTEASK